MIVKQPIPTIPFDASKHVVQGREKISGDHVFFNLESIISAERIVAAAPPAPTPPPEPLPLPAPVEPAAPTIHPDVREAISKLVDANMSLATRVAALEQDNASLLQRIQKLEADNEVWHHNAAQIKALTGIGSAQA